MKRVLAGLILVESIALANVTTNQNIQINQESFDLIKSALIRVLKENKELKERISDLEDKSQRNADNLLVVASYLKPKTEQVKLAQKKHNFVASVSIKPDTSETKAESETKPETINQQEVNKLINALDNGDSVEAIFIRDSNVRENPSLNADIIKRFEKESSIVLVGYQKVGGNIWYLLEDGGFTHFHNIKYKEIKESNTAVKNKEPNAEQDTKESIKVENSKEQSKDIGKTSLDSLKKDSKGE